MTVRFGLVGCGRIGATGDDRVRGWPNAHVWLPYSHAAAVRAIPGAALVAVCDVDDGAARAAQTRHQVPAVYTSHEEMFSREQLDAVIVATRTRERGKILRDAVRAGVRAIACEKPLCNTLEEADDLAKVLEGVPFVYGTPRRFMPVFAQARATARSAAIGPLEEIVIRFGRGQLFWCHPHSVDLACFLAGDDDVAWVRADLDLDLGDVRGDVIDADPIVRSAHIRFRSGVGATLVAVGSWDVELWGPAGSICVRSDGLETRRRAPRDAADDSGAFSNEECAPTPAASSGSVASKSALVSALTERADVGYDIRLAVRNQEILFAFVESQLRGGARVSLPLPRRGLTITGRSGSRYA